MTDDLATMTAFAEARLAEDEAGAKETADADAEFWADVKGDGTHFARHDPARVLRDVESFRLLLAVIQRMPHDYVDGDTWYSCSQAADPDPSEGEDGPGSGCLDEERAGKPCDCGRDPRARRMLAAIVMRWSTHPGYLEDWKP